MKAQLIGAGVAAVVGVVAAAYFTEPSDDAKVRASLAEIEKSGPAGDAFGLVEELSRGLTFNGNSEVSRGEVSQWVRQGQPEIRFHRREPVLTGDEARLQTDVSVKANWMGMESGLTFEGVEMIWAKEQGWKWGVFPVSAWRLREINGESVQPSSYRTSL
jgi:hypothetical protein